MFIQLYIAKVPKGSGSYQKGPDPDSDPDPQPWFYYTNDC